MKIAFDVPQKDLPEIRKGLTAVLTVNGGIQKAEIRLMEPVLDKAKMMRAEIWLDRAAVTGLNSGACLPITVVVEQLTDVILLPASALIEGPKGKTHVFAVTEGHISAKPVEVLGRTADRVAVQGIDAKIQVVENTYLGWATLSSGEKVEVVQ